MMEDVELISPTNSGNGGGGRTGSSPRHQLRDIERGELEDDDDDANNNRALLSVDDYTPWYMKRNVWSKIWQLCAIGTLIVNILTIAIFLTPIMFVAGTIAIVVAIIVFIVQFKLSEMDSLRMVQNALRKEVNRLAVENDKLTANVTKLESQTMRLHESEKKLDSITKDQGTNVNKFVELVKENRETVKDLKFAVKSDTMQTLVSAVMRADVDQSATYDEKELKILEMRMSGVKGVRVNGDRLRAELADPTKRSSLSAILHMLEQMDRKDVPDTHKVFAFDEQDLRRGQ